MVTVSGRLLTPSLFIYTALHMLLCAFEFKEMIARGRLELKLQHPDSGFQSRLHGPLTLIRVIGGLPPRPPESQQWGRAQQSASSGGSQAGDSFFVLFC